MVADRQCPDVLGVHGATGDAVGQHVVQLDPRPERRVAAGSHQRRPPADSGRQPAWQVWDNVGDGRNPVYNPAKKPYKKNGAPYFADPWTTAGFLGNPSMNLIAARATRFHDHRDSVDHGRQQEAPAHWQPVQQDGAGAAHAHAAAFAQPEQLLLQCGEDRPVSAKTTALLAWCRTRLAA